MAGGEGGIPFYNLSHIYDITANAWNYSGLGSTNGIIVGTAPLYKFLSILQDSGISAYMLEAGLISFLFIVSGLSIYFLTKAFFPKIGDKYLFFAVIFYWFNPISLVNVWNRFLYNYMFFWALLPLATYFFVKGLNKKSYHLAITTTLLTAVFSYGISSVVFSILIWSVFIYLTVFSMFFNKDKFFYLKYFFAAAISFFIFNFWWIVQAFIFSFSSSYQSSVDEFFSSPDNIVTLNILSDLLGKISYSVRFLHYTFVTTGPSWAKYFDEFPLLLLGFLSPIVIFWTILRFKIDKRVLLFGTLFILSIYLIKGSSDPAGSIFSFFFNRFTILQVFRNPFEKFGFITLLSSAPLVAFGASKLELLLKNVKYRYFYNLLLVIVSIFYAYPFLTGLVFSSTDLVGKDLRYYYVKVPDYYRDVSNFFNNQHGDFRFISSPIGGEGNTYDWEFTYSGIDATNSLIGGSNISFNTAIPLFNGVVNNLIKYQLNRGFLNFFPYTNSRFLLWRGDIDYKERRMANPDSVLSILYKWENEGVLKKVFNAEKLIVFEIDDKYFWPKIYSTRNLYISDVSDITKISKYINDYPERKVGILRENYVDHKLDFDKVIVSPKLSKSSAYGLSEDVLLSNLFHAEHLPDRWYYPFIRLKEDIELTTHKDYYSLVLYQTGLLGKRAVEVYKLYQKNANPVIIKNAEQNYKESLEKMLPTISEIVKSTNPVSGVVINSLLYQQELFRKVESSQAEYLSRAIEDKGIKPRFEPSQVDEFVVFKFDIMTPGFYKPDLTELGQVSEVIIDTTALENKEGIFLDKGSHELAVKINPADYQTTYIKVESIVIDNDNLPSWKIDIPDVPTTFKVSFDYRFIRNSVFNLTFAQNIDSSKTPIFTSSIEEDEEFHGWRTYERIFTTSPGAEGGNVKLAPKEYEDCKKVGMFKKECSLEFQDIEVEIRNLNVQQIIMPEISLIMENPNIPVSDTEVDFEQIKPTKYKVNIKKYDDRNEMLVFSELFDLNWAATYDDGTVIPNEEHYLVNNYANGWLLKKQGDYTITLQFEPQNFLDMGKQVSLYSILGGLVYLGIAKWKKAKHSN